ncbi:MAG: winged helix-turn-helix transcriptional regulator [Clostridia bacterium]|nr:winged helix-turn-helix transcriptional regulator [Clostridia bacterium]
MTICCETHEKDEVELIRNALPSEDHLFELAEFFKMLGDSTRIKIICVLFHGEMCVGGIVDLLEMNQSAISHQLRILKQARIVKGRKEGKQVFYSLDDHHIKMIYEMGMEHVFERI